MSVLKHKPAQVGPEQVSTLTLWLRRAHSISHHRQTLNLLTYALGINGLALHLRRQRHAPPLAA